MKFYQLAIALIALVFLREVSGDLLMQLTGLGALANLGGLAVASFFAGWLAGAISELGPSYGQLKGLAALGVIASLGISFIKGVNLLALAIVLRLIFYTPLSYVCLLLGAAFAEVGIKGTSRHPEDRPGPGQEDPHGSAANGQGTPDAVEPAPEPGP